MSSPEPGDGFKPHVITNIITTHSIRSIRESTGSFGGPAPLVLVLARRLLRRLLLLLLRHELLGQSAAWAPRPSRIRRAASAAAMTHPDPL